MNFTTDIGFKFTPVTQSLMDTDLYKFTMMQAVFHQYPHAKDTEFHFKCRNPGINMVQFIDEFNRQLDHLCTLSFTTQELDYLRSLYFMKDDFVDSLINFRLNRKYINVVPLNDKEIDIVIRGPWYQTILFEIPVLSIVNEIYFRNTYSAERYEIGKANLEAKIARVLELNDPEFNFSDFGTRRRYSREWQEYVVGRLKEALPQNFTGTSNVLLAMKYNLTPIGTMAHEWLQSGQVLGPRLRDSQKFALETWVQEYRGHLGVALTDVIGTDVFLEDFDLYFCKLFDGLRHDSGNPFDWANKVIAHYKKMKIDPMSKSLVFSDGLNIPKAIELFNAFKGKAKMFFGIGTNLTNDLGVEALNIVIKMTSCNGSPVAKISDTPGKTMCQDKEFLAHLCKTFKVGEYKEVAVAA